MENDKVVLRFFCKRHFKSADQGGEREKRRESLNDAYVLILTRLC